MKTNKSDKNDAEAICEAVGRPTMRFVPPKSRDQLIIQAVHGVGSRLVAERVGLANQIRGVLSEHGIVFAKSLTRLRRKFADMAGLSDEEINPRLRELINDMPSEPAALDGRIGICDRKIRAIFHNSETCQRIDRIEGIGPITATELVAAMGDRNCFKNDRCFAGWLGLVPKQQSTGGRTRLMGISKRGDCYLRTLLIQGARVALSRAGRKQDPQSLWQNKLRDRRDPNVAAVALANKNAGIV
ncbi:IS110 family transposase [Ferruginivarius sediminum]|uniref:IS110 family transposase n=1 Tax=Ferruginivarius sediminum TaxID=2661937 RepID=A0A369T819_9PROT|nr:IS110 family transposase [Ferruginivarius sediminum]RDD60604.1 IS110 family transposase [Ferruginivarius sediminum]